MLLTYKKIAELLQAHRLLDQQRSIASGDGSGEVRIKLAHNIDALDRAHQLAQATRRKVFREMTGGEDHIKPEDPRTQAIGMRMEEIDATEAEPKLWRIPYDKLKPDEVSPQLLNTMMPLLIGVPNLGEPDA